MSVIVIGAGITGLAAAYELAERRVPFVVLEASSRAGGLILTEKIEGFTIEAGPDSMLAQKPAGVQLCEELGLGPRLISTEPPRRAYVLKDGGLFELPSPAVLGIPTTRSGIAKYDLLSWKARARLAIEPLVRRAAQPGADESVASFFRRRFGEETVRLIAAPLLGSIHAGDVEALSLRALFPRLVEAESRRGSVIRALRRTHPAAGDAAFRSLSSGMGDLVAAIERRLPEGCLRCDAPVDVLRKERDGWVAVSGGETLRARSVVLATPSHAAARILASVDAEAAEASAEVPYVSTATIALAWPRHQVRHDLAGSGFVVARTPDAPRITACTWVSSKWSGRAPAGWALLRAFVGGSADPQAIDLPDDELIEMATRELSRVLNIDAPPHLKRVYRWRNAGAQHNVGHLARVERIEARLSQLPGLFVAGSGFRSIGIPDCIADGRTAAALAAARSGVTRD